VLTYSDKVQFGYYKVSLRRPEREHMNVRLTQETFEEIVAILKSTVSVSLVLDAYKFGVMLNQINYIKRILDTMENYAFEDHRYKITRVHENGQYFIFLMTKSSMNGHSSECWCSCYRRFRSSDLADPRFNEYREASHSGKKATKDELEWLRRAFNFSFPIACYYDYADTGANMKVRAQIVPTVRDLMMYEGAMFSNYVHDVTLQEHMKYKQLSFKRVNVYPILDFHILQFPRITQEKVCVFKKEVEGRDYEHNFTIHREERFVLPVDYIEGEDLYVNFPFYVNMDVLKYEDPPIAGDENVAQYVRRFAIVGEFTAQYPVIVSYLSQDGEEVIGTIFSRLFNVSYEACGRTASFLQGFRFTFDSRERKVSFRVHVTRVTRFFFREKVSYQLPRIEFAPGAVIVRKDYGIKCFCQQMFIYMSYGPMDVKRSSRWSHRLLAYNEYISMLGLDFKKFEVQDDERPRKAVSEKENFGDVGSH